MKLNTLLKSIVRFANKNKEAILIGIGICGFGGAIVQSSAAAPVAKEKLEERKKDLKVDKLPVVEVIKTAGPIYIPTIVTSVASAACIIGGTASTMRHNAALAAAYTISENALTDYKEAAKKTIGEKKEKLIEETVAKEKIDNLPSTKVIVPAGNIRCIDTFTGNEFYSNHDKINAAIEAINYDIATSETYMSLNDLQEELGIPCNNVGDILGWNVSDGKLSAEFTSELSVDNIPCLAMTIYPVPKQNYRY